MSTPTHAGQAIVFDFDGLIVDTETPLFEAWRLTYAHYSLEPISIHEWSVSLGRHDDDPLMLDPFERLQELLDHTLDEAEVQSVRRQHRDDLLSNMPIQPGVVHLLDWAERLGVSVAVASSSPNDWIETLLAARNLDHRFPVVSCAGNGVPGKPDPAVYLHACAEVGADPTRSIALEDSPNGVAAAKAAGMTCIAVPTELGRSLDFSQADDLVSSLEDIDLEAALAALR